LGLTFRLRLARGRARRFDRDVQFPNMPHPEVSFDPACPFVRFTCLLPCVGVSLRAIGGAEDSRLLLHFFLMCNQNFYFIFSVAL
jgi:hypothetical protein